MKNKRIMAIILSAIMAISVCVPMSGMSAFAADIAEELNVETEADAEDAETAPEEEEAVSPENEEAAEPEEPEDSDVPETLDIEEEQREEQEAAEQIANPEATESDIITTEENTEASEEKESAEESVKAVDEEPAEQEEDEKPLELAEPEQAEVDREAMLAAGANVAQAIWTESNTTLTFYYGPLVSVGNTFRGNTVTEVWSGNDVTAYGDSTPAWAGWDNSVAKNVTSAVFDKSFLAVKLTSTENWFKYCEELENVDFQGLDTSNVLDMQQMFFNCESLTSLDLSGFNTSNAQQMYRMFGYCTNLVSLNVSGFDTSDVMDMGGMFEQCNSLTSLNVSGFKTSKVKHMDSMFYNCTSLTSLDLSGFDTSQVTDMNKMFLYCENLKSLNLSGFNTSNVEKMYYMFSNCKSLTSLDVSSFNTSKVTDMYSMFNTCQSLKSLDVSSFDTSQVTNMQYMFGGCTGLTDLNVSKFKTSNVTMMTSMFAGCESLTSLDVSSFDMSKVEDAAQMFAGCYDLKTIYCSASTTDWKCSSKQMFYWCNLLVGKDGAAKVAYADTGKSEGSMAKAASLGGYFTPKNSTASGLGKTTRGDMFNLANNVKVTWKEVPGAKYYKVYREGITDPKETRKDPVIVTTGLVGWDKEEGLTNGHAYRYKIVASTTGKGDSSGDSPLFYSKVMYRLQTVVIRPVKNTAPGKVTVKYDKTTSGDSYVLQYCERKDMVGAKTKVVLGANNTSYTISGLKKGKTYYISIRVRKKVDGIDYYTTFGVPKKIEITQ